MIRRHQDQRPAPSRRFDPIGADFDVVHRLAAEAPAGTGLRYVCVIAHVVPDGAEHTFEADTAGTLAAEPRGEGGFGYDPLFVPGEADGRTMAELSDAEKDAISHRGRAARALQAWLGATEG